MAEFVFGKVNLRVRDIGAAVEYARDVLGGEVMSEPHSASFGQVAIVSISGLAMEIVQPNPGTVLAQAIEKRGEGLDSVGFVTQEVSKVAKEMAERGARIVEPTGPDIGGTAWIHPRNPLSMSMEFYTQSA